ncbi:hypothetical protein ACFO9E_32695 [Streptomyces maoxianensis]|uniref:Uncharacterized protein n=1 Tax=Streptomyces maoxianensis TaxID=1459942 RepID=A0ABV9GH02_9ACTN
MSFNPMDPIARLQLVGTAGAFPRERPPALSPKPPQGTGQAPAHVPVRATCSASVHTRFARGQSSVEVTNRMHEATDKADRSQRSERARETLSEFIEAAAPGVR